VAGVRSARASAAGGGDSRIEPRRVSGRPSRALFKHEGFAPALVMWPHSDEGVVLVHDYLLVMRGAERTFEEMAACYPNAPIATLLYDPRGTGNRFRHREVRTSFVQPVAASQRRFRRFLPLLPLAAERLPVDGARLVISSSSAFAQGVRPAPDAIHISYCHSPFRYAWHERDRTAEHIPAPARPLVTGVLGAVQRWDLEASKRVTAYIANSQSTRQRIADFYGRESTVVHPPVEIERFRKSPDPRDYFLIVGEVTGHKKTDVALAAAEHAGVKAIVVGDGPDRTRLERRFRGASFLGRVDDRRLIELYAGCRALVVPAIEEFGITMVEAHAAGRPVLAAAQGGALEILDDGDTGILFPPGSVNSLAEAMRETDWEGFDVDRLRASARRFSSNRFRQRFTSEVARTLDMRVERKQPARATRAREQP
jgi:glycosyltransferase involved in cell wall biosynthesis